MLELVIHVGSWIDIIKDIWNGNSSFLLQYFANFCTYFWSSGSTLISDKKLEFYVYSRKNKDTIELSSTWSLLIMMLFWFWYWRIKNPSDSHMFWSLNLFHARAIILICFVALDKMVSCYFELHTNLIKVKSLFESKDCKKIIGDEGLKVFLKMMHSSRKLYIVLNF